MAFSRDYSGDISGSFLKRNPYNFSSFILRLLCVN
jgi:hypothetical protein